MPGKTKESRPIVVAGLLPLSRLFRPDVMQVEVTRRLASGPNPLTLLADGLITKCEAFFSMQTMPKISPWDCAWPDNLDLKCWGMEKLQSLNQHNGSQTGQPHVTTLPPRPLNCPRKPRNQKEQVGHGSSQSTKMGPRALPAGPCRDGVCLRFCCASLREL